MPWWYAQFWFHLMLKMLQDFPLQLPSNTKLLILQSNQQAIYPLLPKMRLLAAGLLGKQSETENWRRDYRNYHRVVETNSKYEAILKKWTLSRNEDHTDVSVENVLSFLHVMYTKGCLYSGMCGARSALPSVVCIKGFSKLLDHPMISRYLKRIFNRHLFT